MMTCVYCQQYFPWAALSDGVGYTDTMLSLGMGSLGSNLFTLSTPRIMPIILVSLESTAQEDSLYAGKDIVKPTVLLSSTSTVVPNQIDGRV